MDDKTIICRCEEITAEEINEAIDAGCRSISTIKKYTRSGMGSCQGRVCAPIIAGILKSRGLEISAEDKSNFPCIPISLKDLEVVEDEQ